MAWYYNLKSKLKAKIREVKARARRDSVRTQLRRINEKNRQQTEKIVETLDRLGVINKTERAVQAIKTRLRGKRRR